MIVQHTSCNDSPAVTVNNKAAVSGLIYVIIACSRENKTRKLYRLSRQKVNRIDNKRVNSVND